MLHTLGQVQALPESYFNLTDQELYERIVAAKRALGDKLVILGHHYQRDDVICHADITGDSFKLSQLASQRQEAQFIVFCGVHFMAESADILSAPHQKVILPDLGAGCSMADMASEEQVERSWAELMEAVGETVLPITYMNSAAALKAFCGERGGAVCTSSNAQPLLAWAFQQKERVLFFPDQHLGRNTGVKMGIPLDEMVVWDPEEEFGGNSIEELQRAKLILWKGHCSVHQRFNERYIAEYRAQYPGIKILVHPECRYEVVSQADFNGSTNFIIKKLAEAEPGSTWAVGTELNLVNRLIREHSDKNVMLLGPDLCMCSTMFRIAPQNLLWALERLLEGEVVNQITVDAATAHWARVALDRMLAIHGD